MRMLNPISQLLAFAIVSVTCVSALDPSVVMAQDLGRLLSRPGSDAENLTERFDVDRSGVLEKAERIAARTFLHTEAIESVKAEFRERDKNGDGKLSRDEVGGGFRNPFRRADANRDGYVDSSEAVGGVYRPGGIPEASEEPAFPVQNGANSGSGLYDMSTFRTLYLEFDDNDWLGEMHDFYHTGLEVPADLIVDGEVYRDVGVRYRGNSSFFLMAPDKKRSLNLSIDHGKKKQNLYGYETLNLHNGAEDPTFLREVVYLRICRDYMPALRANWVRVILNGENWGVYLNVQQYNNDFVEEWFGSRKGVRWKAPAGFGATKGLSYEGEDRAAYSGYELKNQDDPEKAWADLIHLCKVLSTTPDEELEAQLKPLFNIDGALWSLALENVFVDEGYVIRKSDYSFFQDKNGRFHLLQHDGNEVFNAPHGPGLPRDFVATKLEPLHNLGDPKYPVIHRLLKIPHLRARYLAHMRTIIHDWLDWGRLEPLFVRYHKMIADEVLGDERKLFASEDFEDGVYESVNRGRVLGVKEFVERRLNFLSNHELLQGSGPDISNVRASDQVFHSKPITITAKIGGEAGADWVGLYWASKRNETYEVVEMHDDGQHRDGAANDGVFGAEIPAQKKGSRFQYYVEARLGANDELRSSFYPQKAESGALTTIVR